MKEKLKEIWLKPPETLFEKICNVSFNLTWLFLLLYFVTKSVKSSLLILLVWCVRHIIGKAKHYKYWLDCMLLQIAVFSTFGLSFKYINIVMGIISVLWGVFLLSGWADIKVKRKDDIEPEVNDKTKVQDTTLWDNTSKYQPLIDFLKYESSTANYDDYLKAEEDLKYRVSTKTYLIYKRKFIDNKTFYEIGEEFSIDNRNIVHELDKCYFFIIGRLGL